MSEAEIREIPLDLIVPNPNNRHVGGYKKLEELADSIKAQGVIQPAVIRLVGLKDPRGKEGAEYELVAGERRWRAAKMAGLETIPCMIRELDDAAAKTLQLIENVQREDVHPLDEADGYAALVDGGKTVEEIAAATGRSVPYIYQRLQLRALVPNARELLIDGKIGVAHALQIARLSEDQQEEVLHDFVLYREDDPPSVRELASYIQNHLLLELKKTAWKLDDETLCPEAGSCIACKKRTGYSPALFQDLGAQDYCTDRACFKAKGEAMVAKKRAELQKKGEEAIEVSMSYTPKVRGAVKRYEWDECKKSDPGAVRALVVEGEGAGRLTWAKTRMPIAGTPAAAEDMEAKKRQRTITKARADLHMKLYLEIRKAAELELAKKGDPMPVELLATMARHFWDRTYNDAQIAIAEAEGWAKPKGDNWSHIAYYKIKTMDAADLELFLVILTFGGASKPSKYGYALAPELVKGMKMFGLDTADSIADVADEYSLTAEELAPRWEEVDDEEEEEAPEKGEEEEPDDE